MGKSDDTLIAAISSTVRDLPEHREELRDACLEQHIFPKMMEHLPASPDDAVKASLKLVDAADIYIAIIAFRYGYVPHGYEISITEMEYERAIARSIPRIVFLMHEDHPLKKSDVETGPGAIKLEALRKRMEKDQVVKYFKSPDDLHAVAVNSLSQLQQSRESGGSEGLAYDTAIVEMFHPAQSPIGKIMNQIEPFPGFPYFSPESDHPSQWPPRIFKERNAFHDLIVEKLGGAAALELAKWRKAVPMKISRPGTPETDPLLNYSALRNLLTEGNNDLVQIEQLVGPACAAALPELEAYRARLEENAPNRLLIIRVMNQGQEDVSNFYAEISLKGSVYDVTLNSMGSNAKSEEWTPNRFSIEIPLLRPGYKVDVNIWYYYLPVESMVFPGAMDFKWSQTQGIVVENLVASGARILHSDKLLDDLTAYNRYPVDPVRNSPGFGKLPEVGEKADEEVLQTEKGSDVSYLRISAPEGKGPYALFSYISLYQGYRQKNDAYEAQLIFANALNSLYEGLKTAVLDGGGQLVYESFEPVSADFSKFSGEHTVSGKLLVIFKAKEVVDFSKLPGADIIGNIASINADCVDWDTAKYEVVLHFFTDTKDSAGDSKRVLTKRLGLDEIFDTASEKRLPNIISKKFERLIEYTHGCLVNFYHQPFTLEQDGDSTVPFYIVARNSHVSENVYLPEAWMKIAKIDGFDAAERAACAAALSRMYDYGNQSRELEEGEFGRLFN